MKLTSTLSKQKRNRLIFYCILLAYPILQFCVFYLGVNGNSILLAFKSYSYDNGTYDFVGFDNFISLFEYLRVQPEMKTMFLNSASAYFVSTIVGISLGVLFSYYIYKKFACHGLFKVLLFLPQILSTLVLAVIFQFIANRAIPSIAEQWFSLELDGLLKNGTETVFPTLLFFSVWAGFGTHVIMFVGAMGNISDSIIESAQIDGTTAFTEFIYIIFPMIYPTFVTFMVVQIGEFLFIKNYSRTEPSLVKIQNITDRYIAVDLLSFATKRISNEYIVQPNEGLVLMRDEDFNAELKIIKEENITNNFSIRSVTDNYFVLDYASLSLDGGIFTEEMPLSQLFERLLRARYKGKVYIRQSFKIDSKSNIKVIVERNRYLFIKINEHPINLKQCDFDVNFLEGDISSCVQEGENIFEYCIDYFQHEGVYFALFDPMATESIRNCLYYNTHIENIYLKGDFIIGENGNLKKREGMPQIASQNYLNGYPFFVGNLSLLGWYDYNGEGARELSLANGRFCVANVYINDAKVNFTMQTVMDITQYLNMGKNTIKIILKSSLRNLLGPHHYKLCAEPMSVYPFLFTMRGQWEEGEAKYYTHDYNCVPFGLDEIKIISKQEIKNRRKLVCK